jgi:methionine-rich copper-binding protein CopC
MRPVVRSRVRRVLAAAGIPLLLGAVLGAVLGLTLVVSPASAHTDLVSATPSSGSTLDGVPAGVELGFATSVQARLTQVVVSDTDGRDHVVGPVASFDTRVEARVDGLRPGRYTVAYRVVAADGHPVVGRYAFVVAAGAETAPPTSGAVSGGPAPSAPAGRPWLAPLLGGLAVAVVVVLRVRHAGRRVTP